MSEDYTYQPVVIVRCVRCAAGEQLAANQAKRISELEAQLNAAIVGGAESERAWFDELAAKAVAETNCHSYQEWYAQEHAKNVELVNRVSRLGAALAQYENWFAEHPEEHGVPGWLSCVATETLAADDKTQEPRP
jgi:hypothetical protein